MLLRDKLLVPSALYRVGLDVQNKKPILIGHRGILIGHYVCVFHMGKECLRVLLSKSV